MELVGCFPPALAFNKKHMLSRNRLDILKKYGLCKYLSSSIYLEFLIILILWYPRIHLLVIFRVKVVVFFLAYTRMTEFRPIHGNKFESN